jgi:hypothetical protein
MVIWLDPPLVLRAWRLLMRPLKTQGKTRAELPAGNPDHLAQQYGFAWRSLRKDARFRAEIAAGLSAATVPVLPCYSRVDTDSALALWTKAAEN